jgi:hypothetical protein
MWVGGWWLCFECIANVWALNGFGRGAEGFRGRELSVREEGAMDWDLEELERGGSSDRWGVC